MFRVRPGETPTVSRTAHPFRGRTWLRVLVLLLALWVPAAHAQAHAAPAFGASAETSEHDPLDVLDALVRPPVCAVHRADVPDRPASLPDPAPLRPAVRAWPAGPRVPYATPLLSSVVLRC